MGADGRIGSEKLMALPFKVFDMERYTPFEGIAYCLRCQWWVPTVGPFSGSLDPHIEDHLTTRFAMKRHLHRLPLGP